MSVLDHLIVGLGNPGRRYERTWHNLGFLCLDVLAKRHHFRCTKIRFKGLLAETHLYGGRQIFLRPQTYMNLSGESVREAVHYYRLEPSQCLIILDDFDLPLGSVRLRKQGSGGSHNGLRSIIYHLESDLIPRLRIGFGPQPPDYETADFVLSKIPPAAEAVCQKSLETAADAVELMLSDGIDFAMNRINGEVL